MTWVDFADDAQQILKQLFNIAGMLAVVVVIVALVELADKDLEL